MKIYDLNTEDGRPHAFEVSNDFLSRYDAYKLVEGIPGVEIVRRPRYWDLFGDEVFCVFKMGSQVLELWEPFGDNSRYHVGANPPGWCPELDVVKAAFAAYTVRWSGFFKIEFWKCEQPGR